MTKPGKMHKVVLGTLAVMLVASLLLAMTSVAYAVQGASPAGGSCCGGHPPCHVKLSKCGWCCLGELLKLWGYIDYDYDANCNVINLHTSCGWLCGVGGCSP